MGEAGIQNEARDKILLVVNEVAANSIEHSGGGSLRLTWTDLGPSVQVTVEDDGVFHIQPRTTEVRGLGLKIAVCLAEEVRIRGGRAEAPGTAVTVRMPAPRSTASGAATAPRLLVVEDDRFCGRSLSRFLEGEGYDVTLATTYEAGRFVLSRTPDLVIVDLSTSGGVVDQVCQEVKQFPGTPVLAMSVLPPPASLPAEVTEFLRKPVHPVTVSAAVRRLLGRPGPKETAEVRGG
jgi:CheY-like chemotaxis protein